MIFLCLFSLNWNSEQKTIIGTNDLLRLRYIKNWVQVDCKSLASFCIIELLVSRYSGHKLCLAYWLCFKNHNYSVPSVSVISLHVLVSWYSLIQRPLLASSRLLVINHCYYFFLALSIADIVSFNYYYSFVPPTKGFLRDATTTSCSQLVSCPTRRRRKGLYIIWRI